MRKVETLGLPNSLKKVFMFSILIEKLNQLAQLKQLKAQ